MNSKILEHTFRLVASTTRAGLCSLVIIVPVATTKQLGKYGAHCW